MFGWQFVLEVQDSNAGLSGMFEKGLGKMNRWLGLGMVLFACNLTSTPGVVAQESGMLVDPAARSARFVEAFRANIEGVQETFRVAVERRAWIREDENREVEVVMRLLAWQQRDGRRLFAIMPNFNERSKADRHSGIWEELLNDGNRTFIRIRPTFLSTLHTVPSEWTGTLEFVPEMRSGYVHLSMWWDPIQAVFCSNERGSRWSKRSNLDMGLANLQFLAGQQLQNGCFQVVFEAGCKITGVRVAEIYVFDPKVGGMPTSRTVKFMQTDSAEMAAELGTPFSHVEVSWRPLGELWVPVHSVDVREPLSWSGGNKHAEVETIIRWDADAGADSRFPELGDRDWKKSFYGDMVEDHLGQLVADK
ncbi:hypothetical protein Pan14r_25290 [Crateriforma conspicua]|uniref:Uncharacterized protein n=2 Tax=Crateriforma conspicua TaxID=2527996 RepID=A0A5C5Y5M6_9PLAN|nr:hypothetical protein Mal65_39950 [Crateriforma conspicua]TWT70228.1 hypothetical protein Pan14r_25290 [Crateriforma conspicua]